MAYPTVTEVPVIIPQSQVNDIYIAFPITVGMDCLLIISEQELDAWIGGGESENDIRFDLTSAIAIPGLWYASEESNTRYYYRNPLRTGYKCLDSRF